MKIAMLVCDVCTFGVHDAGGDGPCDELVPNRQCTYARHALYDRHPFSFLAGAREASKRHCSTSLKQLFARKVTHFLKMSMVALVACAGLALSVAALHAAGLRRCSRELRTR